MFFSGACLMAVTCVPQACGRLGWNSEARAGTLCPRPRLEAVRPAAAGGSPSVVHEMAFVQDLCASAHQGGQVLVRVVAAEVELAA